MGKSGCFVCWVFKLNGLLDVGGPCCQWIQVVSHVLMCVALNWRGLVPVIYAHSLLVYGPIRVVTLGDPS